MLVFSLVVVLGGVGLAVGAAPEVTAAEALDTLGGAIESSDTDRFVPVPVPSAEAIRYHREGQWLWLFARIWGLAVPAAVLVSGISARLRNAAWVFAGWIGPASDAEMPAAVGRWSKVRHLARWLLAVAAYGVLFIALVALVGMPLSYYAGYVRPHAYGLSNQSAGRWLELWATDLGVGLVLTIPALWAVYGLIRWSPRRWWLWAGLLAVPVGFVMAMVKPVVVDPLYNDFGPLRDRALETRILALADRAGVGGAEVLVVDKSRDTQAVNAYVTGFLGTKRIVLWDTLLAKLDDDQVLAVVGHELGHYVRGDVVRGLLVSSVLTLLGLYAVYRGSRWALNRHGSRLRIARLADIASLPLLLVLSRLAALPLVPVGYTYSRHIEFEADRFALELTRDNHAAASAFAALQRENLRVPRPGRLDTIFRSSHPSLGDRIDFCNSYHPWISGDAPRYGHLFVIPATAADSTPDPSSPRLPLADDEPLDRPDGT